MPAAHGLGRCTIPSPTIKALLLAAFLRSLCYSPPAMPSIALPTPRNDPAAVASRRKRLALGALLTVVVVGLLLSATFRHDLIAFARRLGVSGAGWLLFAATSALTLFIAALSLLPLLLAFWCVRVGRTRVRCRAARVDRAWLTRHEQVALPGALHLLPPAPLGSDWRRRLRAHRTATAGRCRGRCVGPPAALPPAQRRGQSAHLDKRPVDARRRCGASAMSRSGQRVQRATAGDGQSSRVRQTGRSTCIRAETGGPVWYS